MYECLSFSLYMNVCLRMLLALYIYMNVSLEDASLYAYECLSTECLSLSLYMSVSLENVFLSLE